MYKDSAERRTSACSICGAERINLESGRYALADLECDLCQRQPFPPEYVTPVLPEVDQRTLGGSVSCSTSPLKASISACSGG